MGSYSPVPRVGPGDVEALLDQVHRPVLAELARRGAPFVGLLYAGLMMTESGPKVLEFNCRFGDPETQSIVPRLQGDLLQLLHGAATGNLSATIAAGDEAAVTIVLAAPDYPQRNDVGAPIEGLREAEASGALVFHAGTAMRGGTLVTNGGRILNVTGVAEELGSARAAAYEGVGLISFPGMRYRTDIAAGAEARVG
jgi:phosphoribosylamine--glycine ligase